VLHISENVGSLLTALAEFLIEQCEEAIRRNGRFTISLSGGSSPKKLFELLSSEKYRNRIQWDKVYFFFGDERNVPHDDAQSNYKMAKEALFVPLNINKDHVFPVETNFQPAEAASKYEQRIHAHFNGACKFDLILLGVGDDAHTASLFPHTDVLQERKALVKEVFVSKVNQFRITLTAPLINEAKVIVFLTYGAGKAEAVRHILKDKYNPEEYPAQLIKPSSGKVHWFLDTEAAAKIS
jgi:6-phosphogluconolactonase